MPASPDRILDLPGTEGFSLLHVNAAELDDLVQQHGQNAELRQAVQCPCIRPDTGAPAAGCVGCRGFGYLYPAGRRIETVVLLSSRSVKREDKAAGSRVRGDAQATFRLGVVPAQGDLVLPANESHVVAQTLTRARRAADVDLVRARLDEGVTLPDLPVAEERLLYPTITAVDAVAFRRTDRPTEVPIIAEQGRDFDVDDGNRIVWRDGGGPPAGSTYTVRYRAPAAFIVEYDPALFRSEAGTQYPFRCAVHRLDSWSASRTIR